MSGQGDKIEGTVGDDSRGIAVGKDIKQETTTASGNVVNLNLSPAQWVEAVRGGDLSVADATILQTQITGLQTTVTDLKGTVAGLDKVVAGLDRVVQSEIQASKERGQASDRRTTELADSVKELTRALELTQSLRGEVYSTEERVSSLASSMETFARKLEEQDEGDRPVFDRRTSNLILIGIVLIILLLGIQAWSSLFQNAASAQASAIYLGAIVGWVWVSKGLHL